jgi:integrase
MEAIIKKTKPDIKESSLKTYLSSLRSTFNKIWPDKEFNHTLFFHECHKAMEWFKTQPFNTRKTRLAAIVACSHGQNEKVTEVFRSMMIQDSQKYKDIEKDHTMTDEQRKNWIAWDKVLKLHAELRKRTLPMFTEEKHDLNEIQKFVVLSCYVLIPPRRAMDFAEMVVKEYNKETDNYFDGKNFIFNQYKTMKSHGTQKIPVPVALQTIIKKWMKIHDGKYLFSSHGEKLTSTSLGRILNSIFKKNISVNMLRHSYVTQNLAPLIEHLDKVANEMGHSTQMQKDYIKH